MTKYGKRPILLFDGHCNLCNGSIQWVLGRDRAGLFRFASLQSEVGEDLQRAYGLDTKDIDSVVLIHEGRAYLKSEAALRTAGLLGGGYKLAKGLLAVPAGLRNWVYDLVARNRYRWFGRSEECWLPRPEWKERFLA